MQNEVQNLRYQRKKVHFGFFLLILYLLININIDFLKITVLRSEFSYFKVRVHKVVEEFELICCCLLYN